MRALIFSFTALAIGCWAHAPITPAPRLPLRIEGARIMDSTGATVQLRGAVLPDADSATAATLGVLRVRWNMNAVRIPVSVTAWQREGQPYRERVAAAVARAREAELIVILAAEESTVSGMPAASTRAFWAECSALFRDSAHVVFSVFRRPVATGEPDWTSWRAAMQELFDTVRGAGARQIVAVSSFHRPQGFQGMPSDARVRGENVLYEAHFDAGAALPFGTLPGQVAVYAGEWGAGNCAVLPPDPQAASFAIFQTLFDFDDRGASWTASTFAAGSLVRDLVDYEPTTIDAGWHCGQPGMGQTVLIWTTGDPGGFGALRRDAIASAAGGPASPVVPGQLLSIYIEQMGPVSGAFAGLDAAGRLPFALGGTEVYFDGERAPILFSGQYQLNVQVPRALRPGTETLMQGFYRGVPSSRIRVPVAAAAPELFHDVFSKNAIALNENGTRNSDGNPALAGSIVVVFGTGTGLTSSSSADGFPAPAPHPLLAQRAGLVVGGLEAEILFAGEVPGFVGLTQINARVPRGVRPGAAALTLRIGAQASQAPVVLAVR